MATYPYMNMTVSGILRKAGIPVRRWSDTYIEGENFIRVGNSDVVAGTVSVFIHSDEDHKEVAHELAKKSTAILIGRGFEVSTYDGNLIMLTVQRPKEPPVEDVHAVVKSSGLDLRWLTQKDVHFDYGGKRGRFYIERTGGDKKPRWTVSDSKAEYGTAPIVSKAHSLLSALDALEAYIAELEEKNEQEH